MKQILVVCPVERDIRELTRISKKNNLYSFLYHGFSDSELQQLSKDLERGTHSIKQLMGIITSRYQSQHHKWVKPLSSIDAVLYTSDYPGSAFASILAENLGVIGPNPEIVIRSQHKYYARLDQAKHVPEAVPSFFVLDPLSTYAQHTIPLPFPFFIKPVKSFFSIGAQVVENYQQLQTILKNGHHLEKFLIPFSHLLKTYVSCPISPSCFIAEEWLHGTQVTLEGFVSAGRVIIIGIVDSIMFPNTISFARFQYPSSLDTAILQRMENIAIKYITGIGLNNSFFNIEFMYTPQTDRIWIIELNPRMVSQFADLYEKVDGINTYDLLLQLVSGQQTIKKQGRGKYNFAASCVLRVFQDHLVKKIPSQQSINRLLKLFPDARIELCATPGKKLSQELQDGKSFRYGLIHIGVQHKDEIDKAFETCKQILNFTLKPLIG